MKIIISPAKNMVLDTNWLFGLSTPVFKEDAKNLSLYLKNLDKEALKEILNCNDKLRDLNYERYAHMNLETNLSPALLSYSGLQYKNMGVNVFRESEYEYLDKHLRILSGLYGVLKPFDGITLYRLEMQAKINYNNYTNLYDYWGNRLYDALNDDFIINLASNEYAKALKPYLKANDKFITIEFYTLVDGKPKVKGMIAKMARGQMVRFMAENKVDSLDGIKKFNLLGFAFSEELSTDNMLAFLTYR